MPAIDRPISPDGKPLRLVDNTEGRALLPKPIARELMSLFGDDLMKRLALRQRGAP